MTVNAAILMAALVLSGTVLAQSSGPSTGSAGAGQTAANVTTTGQAPNAGKTTGDSGQPDGTAARAGRPDPATPGNTVGASHRQKPDRRLEHYP
ncbi:MULTISPECIES: hypothetical protein [Bradyrhizobium]|jgi:hypothetical protein|uniref:hypothetical protein n=1 Tax=Bradyrhizobium TaxID=374 RepID=UPI000400061B|nr:MULTISPECIES: hypothetical protein [Bradyrhizobium]